MRKAVLKVSSWDIRRKQRLGPRAILNTLIDKFNQDGILDRQEVYKRTIDFIDERFVYLSQDLDSIERGKQSFKEVNQLVDVEADAGLA